MSAVRIAVITVAILAIVLVCSCDSSDASETDCDGSVYEYDTYGSGHPDYYCVITHVSSDSEVLYAPSVLEGYDVRFIEAHAFDGCTVRSLVLPKNLEGISAEAFTGCSVLTDVYFMGDRPDMDGAFGPGVDFHVMPGTGGWGETDKIQTVTEGGIVYAILPDGAVVSGGTPAGGKLNIPGNVGGHPVKRIGDYSFAGTMKNDGTVERRTDIDDVKLPDGLVSIGQRAFYYNDVRTVSIPHTVTSIRDEAFRACNYLGDPDLPSSLSYIGFEAFRDCHSITELIVPDSVTVLGDGAFYICDSLVSVKIDTGILQRSFGYCSSLETVEFGKNVKKLGYGCFYRCESLRSVEIPDGVKSISADAFRGCTALRELKLGNVEEIGRMAFRDCISLGSFDLPASVRTISGYAFADCTGLKDIYAYGTAPEGDDTVFLNDDAVIHCREDQKASWEASGFGLEIKDDLKETSLDNSLLIAGICVTVIAIMAIIVFVFLKMKK